MKRRIQNIFCIAIALILFIIFALILTSYTAPMKNLSLDLSVVLPDGADSSDFDDKGWTVFVQEGDTKTILEPDYFGCYSGLELGQTFYYSRILKEELDSPTLQIDPVNRNFSVFLDNELIYTDCPDADNRIGYLHLPMHEWDRTDPITIALPTDCCGQTLTIAQSFADSSESASVIAIPANVTLYCGYAYESSLISESFQTAFLAIILFLAGVILLLAFIRNCEIGTLSLAVLAFFLMTWQLIQTTFFQSYFGDSIAHYTSLLLPAAAGTLFIFLSCKAGRFSALPWLVTIGYLISFAVCTAIKIRYPFLMPADPLLNFMSSSLSEWIAFFGFLVIFMMTALFWRKTSRFYRIFFPTVLAALIIVWGFSLLTNSYAVSSITLSLQSGIITYVYCRFLIAFSLAALCAAVADAAQAELERRMEKQLVKQQKELTLASYETMYRQHEEVMMLRHDMHRHFSTLLEMSSDPAVAAYLADLIGQNEAIRPVVHTGNNILDIILNGRLSPAIDAGIRVEIVRAEAFDRLPISDSDLCSLVMNIIDNAVTAASESVSSNPYIRLDIHMRNNFLAIVCRNSANMRKLERAAKKETVPKHGLGLKIVRNITERYEGTIDIEYGKDFYQVRIAIPIN